MKLIKIFALVLLFSNSYGQNQKCKIIKRYDEFSEFTNYESRKFDVSKQSYTGGANSAQMQFLKLESKRGTIMYSMVIFGNKSGCVTKNSGSTFIMKNGEKMYFEIATKKTDCGINFMIVKLTDDDISKLKTELIDKIRISYDDLNEDFTFTEKGQTKFLENLNCITETK